MTDTGARRELVLAARALMDDPWDVSARARAWRATGEWKHDGFDVRADPCAWLAFNLEAVLRGSSGLWGLDEMIVRAEQSLDPA